MNIPRGDGGGCGFHEWITLMDYDQGEFLPAKACI